MAGTYVASDLHIGDGSTGSHQGPSEQGAKYWSAFGLTIVLLSILFIRWIYSPGQDHVASIPLNGDGTWYHNYEVGFEIQDQEIFYHGIGHSIENAKQADIIFLGWSRLIFGLHREVFDDFERRHHLKMFNMGLAGVFSGDFPLRVIRKYGLHPKLWVINADRDLRDFRNGFFYMDLSAPPNFRFGASARVVNSSRMRALKNVVGRNIRWRLKMAIGLLKQDPYRSATSGNWYLENWPYYAGEDNGAIRSRELSLVNGAIHQAPRVDFTCPAFPEEIEGAKRYVEAIGGEVVIIQMPSAFACAQRVHELGSAVAAASFTAEAEQFTSIDDGGHLDGKSARKYSTMFFTWLEQLPQFRRLFPR